MSADVLQQSPVIVEIFLTCSWKDMLYDHTIPLILRNDKLLKN